MAKNKAENIPVTEEEKTPASSISGLLFQAWLSIAVWMSFGLLLEGFIGYRIPLYLNDPVRRELFRLAHTHGALLNIVLLLAVICLDRGLISASKPAQWSLRAGVILMPVGFLLGGTWHAESEPGLAIFLAPLGGVLVIFGVVNLALSALRKK